MKQKIIICVLTISILLFCVTGVFANQYEYNNVKIYISNVLKTTISLKSDYVINQNTNSYFDVALRVTDNHIVICMYGGQPIDTGQIVTGISQVSCGSNTVNYIQSAQVGGVASNGYAPVFRVSFNTGNYYNEYNLSINGSSVKLSTPVTSFSNNVLSWQPVANASGYNIQFSETGTGSYTTVVTNLQSTSYTIYQSGYYIVQAYGVGDYYNSDWSTKIECVYDSSSSSDGGVIGWFTSTVNRFTASIQNFFNNISSVVSSMGEIFTGLTAFLPEAYAGVIWSLAGLLLMFGLFRLIF